MLDFILPLFQTQTSCSVMSASNWSTKTRWTDTRRLSMETILLSNAIIVTKYSRMKSVSRDTWDKLIKSTRTILRTRDLPPLSGTLCKHRKGELGSGTIELAIVGFNYIVIFNILKDRYQIILLLWWIWIRAQIELWISFCKL